MEVQVCDFRSDNFRKDLINSVLNTGFAVITNHGITTDLIETAQEDWRSFFLIDSNAKKSFENEVDSNMGFKGFKTEQAVGAAKPDLKEFFHWQPGQKCPDQALTSTSALFYQLQDLGMVVLKVLDDNMHVDFGFREACLDSDNTILRTLYYPAMDFAAEPGSVRAAAHEDINFITMLVAASAPGLEVQDKSGQWHKVPHQENSVILNIGDMLELMSDGQYQSTTHRVVNADDSTSDRISMPLFIHPRSETLLAPGITAKEFLRERIAQIYGSK